MKSPPVLPTEWYERLLDRADLEESYRELGDNPHFYAESMRGYVRSLQLRIKEAEAHFETAKSLAAAEPEDIPTLIRVFMLETYIFFNTLLKGPVHPTGEIPDVWIPKVPPHILDEYPEIKFVIFSRRNTEGYFRLHLGEFETAKTVFEELIEDERDEGLEDTLCVYYLGLAACHFNLGDEDLGRKHLENASLTLQSGGRMLNRAKGAGLVYAFNLCLGELEEADGWKAFLERLDCPQATKDVFLKRAEVMVQRCYEQTHLVLL